MRNAFCRAISSQDLRRAPYGQDPAGRIAAVLLGAAVASAPTWAFGPRSGQRGGGRGQAGSASGKDRSEEGEERQHRSCEEERSQKHRSETIPCFCNRPGLTPGLERDHAVSACRLQISHGNPSICRLFLQPFICF